MVWADLNHHPGYAVNLFIWSKKNLDDYIIHIYILYIYMYPPESICWGEFPSLTLMMKSSIGFRSHVRLIQAKMRRNQQTQQSQTRGMIKNTKGLRVIKDQANLRGRLQCKAHPIFHARLPWSCYSPHPAPSRGCGGCLNVSDLKILVFQQTFWGFGGPSSFLVTMSFLVGNIPIHSPPYVDASRPSYLPTFTVHSAHCGVKILPPKHFPDLIYDLITFNIPNMAVVT